VVCVVEVEVEWPGIIVGEKQKDSEIRPGYIPRTAKAIVPAALHILPEITAAPNDLGKNIIPA